MSNLEGLVDDADLWAIAVRDDDVDALLDHLGDELGAAGNALSLFFGVIAQSVAAQCDDDALAHQVSLVHGVLPLGRNGSLSRIARRLTPGTLLPALPLGTRKEELSSFDLPRSWTCATVGCVR